MSAFDPLDFPWDPWRPDEVAHLLDGVDVPWYVAAGWALDLFLGNQSREHDDLEVAVPNSRFDELADALEGLDVFVITGPAEATPLGEARDQLSDTHQTWIRQPASDSWRVDVFREPSDGNTWICTCEPAIRLPYEALIERTADGMPYGRPEVVVVFRRSARTRRRTRATSAVSCLGSRPSGGGGCTTRSRSLTRDLGG